MRFKWYEGSETVCLWWCPGCEEVHQIPVGPPRGWNFSGTREAPTFAPSILTKAGPRCHSFLEGGQIRFLDDCAHHLAGKTVAVGELPEEFSE